MNEGVVPAADDARGIAARSRLTTSVGAFLAFLISGAVLSVVGAVAAILLESRGSWDGTTIGFAIDAVGVGPGTLVFVGVGVPAATFSGVVFGQRAAVGARWTGAWMGLCTYAVATVVVTAVAGAGSGVGSSPFESLAGILLAPLFAILPGLVLAPLLLVCVAAGVVWAACVRVIAGRPRDPAMAGEDDLSGAVLVILFVLIGVWWFAVYEALASFAALDFTELD